MKRTLLLNLLTIALLPIGVAKGTQDTPTIHHNHSIRRENDGESSSTSLSITGYDSSYSTNSSYSFYVSISNPVDLASLQLEIYFDKTYITPQYVSNEVSDSVFDYKISEDHVSITYVFTSTLNEDTTLFYLGFQTLDKVGKTDIDMAVLDANSSTSNVSVTGANKTISIEKSTAKNYCDFYSTLSKSDGLKQGEEFDFSISSYYLDQIAAGDFVINYDRDELDFASFSNGSFLENTNVTFDHKENADGTITISFVASQAVSSYDFLSLKFKVKNNKSGSTDITFKSTSITDFSFVDFQNVDISSTVSYVYDESLVQNPSMYITGEKNEDNNSLTLTVSLEENSDLAAGDFKLNFPTDYFGFSSYEDVHDNNVVEMFIVNTSSASDGQIEFHIVNVKNNITSQTDLLKIVLDITDTSCAGFATQISLSGSEMCNLNSEDVKLSFLPYSFVEEEKEHSYRDWVVDKKPTCQEKGLKHRSCSVCNYTETEIMDIIEHHFSDDFVIDKEPTCVEKGSKSRHCDMCGARIDVSEVPAKGHTYGEWSVTKEPTCTESGSKSRKCLVCDEVEVLEITPKGHQASIAVIENKIEPTCTEPGSYDSVVYCSNCGMELSRTHKDIPAKGHSYGEWSTTKEPTYFDQGEKQRVCNDCGNIESAILEKKNSTSLIIAGSASAVGIGGLIVVLAVALKRKTRIKKKKSKNI